MKHLLLVFCVFFSFLTSVSAQEEVKIPNYKMLALKPDANYYAIVKDVRAKFELKKQQLASTGVTEKNSEALREEIAQFERWAYNYSFKVGADGKFPNAAAGWANAQQSNPELFEKKNMERPSGTNAVTWSSVGPFNSALAPAAWSNGGGIGRINVVRRHPSRKNVLFAGSASGGLFKSTDLGYSWTAITDFLAGLGVSDVIINPLNASVMYMATGDFDGINAGSISSIGVYKSTDGGASWNATGLTFNFSDQTYIAHLYMDPQDTATIYATASKNIFRTTNSGQTWTSVLASPDPATPDLFNDIVKVVSGTTKRLFVSTRGTGKLYRSENNGDAFSPVHTGTGRLDFDFSPADPDKLFLLAEANPAFSKYEISSNSIIFNDSVTNSVPADSKNGWYNSQQGYNQVITVDPLNANHIWVGEFSAKVSTDGGTTWQNKLNGYYNPGSPTNWGTSYVHSDHHFIDYIGADSIILGNDGGVYIGQISTDDYKPLFNGLVTTQSYSIAGNDEEPDNFIIGNQDNDGRSRVGIGANATYYGASAGDGTATAISRSNWSTRYLGGTEGSLSYDDSSFTQTHNGADITTNTSGAPFAWELQLHNTNETILYAGLGGLDKMTGAPTGTFTRLPSGTQGGVTTFTLANNTATTQKIILIDGSNTVRKSANETSWSVITKPANVNFSSIYAKKTDWNILFATASGYDNNAKIFYSTNNGGTWQNVTNDFPNIAVKKVVMYEGTDTVFVASELGIFFAKISDLTAVPAPATVWSKYGGNSMPNVRVDDMEISYAKKKITAASFGRGVWMADLKQEALPLNNISFNFTGTASTNIYNLNWKVDLADLTSTTLEKSTDGTHFTEASSFKDSRKSDVASWSVTLVNSIEYYRLKCIDRNGKITYSNIIRLTNKSGMQISIYPNPVKGQLFVNSNKKISTVTIYSLHGQQVVYARPMTNVYTFDTSVLPDGNYTVKVENEMGEVVSQKIIKAGK